jgi:uncharacterized membrane protein HdeD (DUF308 family)
MAVLTIVANFIYAFEPVIVDIIDYLGAPLTFILGGVVTLASGYAMQKNSLGLFKQTGSREPQGAVADKSSKSSYAFIFSLGIILGLTTTIMFNYFPDIFSSKLPLFSENGKLGLVSMLILSAILSWPISNLVNNFSMGQVFWYSAGLVALTMGGIFLIDSGMVIFVCGLLYTVAFTTLSVSSLPLAIKRAGYYDKVLCVGIFFSGVAFPEGIIESVLAYLS